MALSFALTPSSKSVSVTISLLANAPVGTAISTSLVPVTLSAAPLTLIVSITLTSAPASIPASLPFSSVV